MPLAIGTKNKTIRCLSHYKYSLLDWNQRCRGVNIRKSFSNLDTTMSRERRISNELTRFSRLPGSATAAMWQVRFRGTASTHVIAQYPADFSKTECTQQSRHTKLLYIMATKNHSIALPKVETSGNDIIHKDVPTLDGSAAKIAPNGTLSEG